MRKSRILLAPGHVATGPGARCHWPRGASSLAPGRVITGPGASSSSHVGVGLLQDPDLAGVVEDVLQLPADQLVPGAVDARALVQELVRRELLDGRGQRLAGLEEPRDGRVPRCVIG